MVTNDNCHKCSAMFTSGPEVIFFSDSTQLSMKFKLFINTVKMLINVKMPIVGIIAGYEQDKF